MSEKAILIFLLSVFLIVVALFNAFVALQLECMTYKKDCEEKGKKWKGRWHIACGVLRAIHAAVLFLFGWQFAATYVLLDFAFYGAILNAARGKPFCKFSGVCENWGSGFDFDCVWLKIQEKTHTPLTCLKIVVATVLLFLIW